MERKQSQEFPQELLNLFDLYVHGDIDRRAFLEGAQKFATAGVTAAMLWESLRPNYAFAQQVPESDGRIQTSWQTVESPAGNGSIKGYFVKPAKATGKLPVVMVVHENRGLNPYIQDVARRLGAANFVAFAPDGLTSAGGYPGDEEKAAAAFRGVDRAKMTEDFVAAAKWLKARPESNGKLGVVGFCFGGGMSNAMAVRLGADLRAAVPYYGGQAPAADVPKIEAPLLIHYAGNDARVNAGWPAYEEALKANGKKYTMHMYDGTQHGFHNDTTPRFDKAAAELSWTRTLDFFNKQLR
ncbi:MAG: dienelactone hydrolase family protein [Bryobacteraceae bacterium]|nr:dienelactone hydrolase family protein [Bryobacteraceae bacterium]